MKKFVINAANAELPNFEDIFLDYINFLEGIKTYCKAMHWGVMHIDVKSKRGTHIYLDDFLAKISDYQDMIAETSQGILGNFITINNIKGKDIAVISAGSADTPQKLCKYLLDNVYTFYDKIVDSEYKGIKSETETFIKDIQQFNYLFSLCN